MTTGNELLSRRPARECPLSSSAADDYRLHVLGLGSSREPVYPKNDGDLNKVLGLPEADSDFQRRTERNGGGQVPLIELNLY
jgi:hypothetical protein